MQTVLEKTIISLFSLDYSLETFVPIPILEQIFPCYPCMLFLYATFIEKSVLHVVLVLIRLCMISS